MLRGVSSADARTQSSGRIAAPAAGRHRLAAPAAGRLWWLAAVAAAFTVVQLVFVAGRLGLSWDEVVYVSQVSSHAPAAYFDPARARGVSLLAAPVALLTPSVLTLRVYLALLSGTGLFLALLAWRGLRPDWQLALAGVAFGGLWVAQYYGPQAMPDEWVAFSVLAATGLFVRAVATEASPRRLRWTLAGLATCVGVAALVRPGDAAFLSGALVIAVVAVRSWRRWPVVAAIAAGLAAGAAQWIAEAYVRFGGPLARWRAAGREQGGFALHLGIWDEFKAVNGPTLCRPCTVAVRSPEISLWWLALPLLAGLGVLAARRYGHFGSSLLAAACGLAVAFQYLFLIDYAAPRFLLPAYALLAIPVSDALGWLVTGVRYTAQPVTTALLVGGLLLQLAVQHVVLSHQVNEKVSFFAGYTRVASDLRQLGVRPPCMVLGKQHLPIAFDAGCASTPSVPTATRARHPAEPVAVLLARGQHLPRYARGWTRYDLPGVHSSLLPRLVYIAPH